MVGNKTCSQSSNEYLSLRFWNLALYSMDYFFDYSENKWLTYDVGDLTLRQQNSHF